MRSESLRQSACVEIESGREKFIIDKLIKDMNVIKTDIEDLLILGPKLLLTYMCPIEFN